jgi:hypothetical protein
MLKQGFADVDFPRKPDAAKHHYHAHARSRDLPSQLRSCIGT